MTDRLWQGVDKRFGGSSGLPVGDVLPELCQQLESHRLCALTAPAGSGKTLLAPIALLEMGSYSRVFVLEPRRVTARLPVLALRQVLGTLVGYRIRFESLWSPGQTRIGFFTYGTALRAFLDDGPGSGDLVIFDEFHERSWESELLLARLLAQPQGPSLLLMSATLDQRGLPTETPVVQSDGRLHPIEVTWEKSDPQLLGDRRRLAQLVGACSARLAQDGRGEQLIFLPGLGAIRACEEVLRADHLPGPVDILHSSLDEGEIRRVVERQAGAGFRRVLSTDIAESSVTLPGVTTVLDSGLVRTPLQDGLGLGVSLCTERAPVASLTQRAGRAGRLGPGRCHRLFTRDDEMHRDPFIKPGIGEIDGKTVALHLAAAGALRGWRDLPWLTAPATDVVEPARVWLKESGLVNNQEVLNERGRLVLDASCSPRAALFGLLAQESGAPTQVLVDWCYALETGPPRSDSARRLDGLLLDKEYARRRDQRLLQRLGATFSSGGSCREALLPSLVRAYRDTLAEFRSHGFAVPRDSSVSSFSFSFPDRLPERFGLILGTAPAGARARVTLFCPVPQELIWETLFEELEEQEEYRWEADAMAVKGRRKVGLGQLVLEQEELEVRPGPEVAAQLMENVPRRLYGEPFEELSRRLALVAEHAPDTLDLVMAKPPEVEAQEILDHLVRGYFQTITRWSKTSPERLMEHLKAHLGYPFLQELERLLPSQVSLPGLRRPLRVHYPGDAHPHIAGKLQHFFGWRPPRLLNGKVPLLCHLLAPNGRPAQITDDLEGFWRGSYQQVRKDLRGRYPKHDWPEEPPPVRG